LFARGEYEILQRLTICTSDFPGHVDNYRPHHLGAGTGGAVKTILFTLAKIFAALVAVVILSGALAIAIMLI
jgi:hypothetical protein